MANPSSPLSTMAALDQLIAEQRAQATATPQGVFSQMDPAVIGLAQGLLAPTKTGSFGESIGQGLAGIQGPLEAMRKQQAAAKDKMTELMLAKAKLEMEAPYYQARADYFSGKGDPSTMTDTDLVRNINRLANIIDQADPKDEPMYRGLMQNFTQELEKRRGIPSKPAETEKKAAPKDDRTLYETIMPEFLGGKQAPEATPRPRAEAGAQDEMVASSPSQGKKTPAPQAGELYKGDNPPKEFPNAIKHPNGTWYVVKEGKTYPVLK